MRSADRLHEAGNPKAVQGQVQDRDVAGIGRAAHDRARITETLSASSSAVIPPS